VHICHGPSAIKAFLNCLLLMLKTKKLPGIHKKPAQHLKKAQERPFPFSFLHFDFCFPVLSATRRTFILSEVERAPRYSRIRTNPQPVAQRRS
jgi:hypothetical protein